MSNIIALNDSADAIKYLCDKDKRLSKVISMVGPITYEPHNDAYSFLIHEIIEQMLSIKAGQKIYERLEILCGGSVCANAVAALPPERIRSIGTSDAKVSYIRNITDAVITGKIDLQQLATLPDAEIIKRLTQFRGIGVWTAKMYLIFVLNRPDILPFEDAAFLQGYRWVYKTNDCSPATVSKKCRKWKPYSSIAARYLYRALDYGLTKTEFHLFK